MAGERFVFLRPEAERIAKAVRKVEGMREGQPLQFRRVDQGGGGGVGLKLCTFTGAWSIGDSKTLTFKNQTTTPNTVSATNLYLGLDPDSECDVLVGKSGSNWYLVQADLTKQPNYSGSGTHVFTIGNAKMRWLGVDSCPDDEVSPAAKALFFG